MLIIDNWKPYKDGIYRDNQAFFSRQSWLEQEGDQSCGYKIIYLNGYWSVDFVMGAKSYWLGKSFEFDLAKKMCSEHLNRMFKKLVITNF